MPADWKLRPARDHGLPHAERLRSIGREPGLGSLALSACWRGLVAIYLRGAHHLHIDGQANLPPAPLIVVANHSSHLDALVLAAALPAALRGRAYALAAGDTFFDSNAKAAFAAYAINALPVWRNRTSARDIVELRARLHEDHAVLILFPEGTRTRTGSIGTFKPGIGALVSSTTIPVVPCHLDGAYAAWPASRRLPRPGPLRLTIGRPLDFRHTAKDRASLHVVSAQCELAVRTLARGL